MIEEACDGATEWIPRHPVGPRDEVISSDDDNNIPLSEVAGRAARAAADSESDDTEDRPLIEAARRP